MSIATVVAKVLSLAGAVSGVREAYDAPPEQIGVWPALVAYPATWTIEAAATGNLTTETQTIALDMLWPRGRDLPRLVATAIPFGDSIPAALMADNDLGGTVEVTLNITGTFGIPRIGPYAGEPVFGWSWAIEVLS